MGLHVACHCFFAISQELSAAVVRFHPLLLFGLPYMRQPRAHTDRQESAAAEPVVLLEQEKASPCGMISGYAVLWRGTGRADA